MSADKKTHLTVKEVRLLAGALGFTRDLVQSKVPPHVIVDHLISLQDLVYYCEEGFFAQELHFTCNNKTGNYNTEVFKRAALHYASNSISIIEIRDTKMAFESYEEFDQRGMIICANTLLRTLKIIGRIIAPEKLIKKIRHVKMSYQEKGRIQLYEFLDLLPLCEKLPVKCFDEEATRKCAAIEKNDRGIYLIDDFRSFMEAEDKRLYSYLNQCYYKEQLRFGKPQFVSEPFENPTSAAVIREPFTKQIEDSAKDIQNIRRRLQTTDTQIKLSRSGSRFQPMNHLATKSQLKSVKKSSSKVSEKTKKPRGISSFSRGGNLNKQTPHRHDGVAIPFRRGFVLDSKEIEERINLRDELAFEINTQESRFKRRLERQLSGRLRNHQEVLKRTRQRKTDDHGDVINKETNKQHGTSCEDDHHRLVSSSIKVFNEVLESNLNEGLCSTQNKADDQHKINLSDKENENEASEKLNKETLKNDEEEAQELLLNKDDLFNQEISGFIKETGNIYIRSSSYPYHKSSTCYISIPQQKMKKEIKERKKIRRNKILDQYRKDGTTQTTPLSGFDDFLANQFRTNEIEGKMITGINSSLDVSKELKYRKAFARIITKRTNTEEKENLYLSSKDSMGIIKLNPSHSMDLHISS